MRSSNPVLSRGDAFTPGQQNYGYHNQPGGYPGNVGPDQQYAPYQQTPQTDQGVMTFDDVVAKTGMTMGVLFLTAAITWVFLPPALLGAVATVAAIVGFVTVLIVSFRRSLGAGLTLTYAAIEGIFLGAISKVFEYSYPGIVTQAVIGTFVAAGLTLAAYKFFNIRVTPKFTKIVAIGTVALMVTYLINLVFVLFGANTGLRQVGGGAGWLSWLISGVAVILAVLNLVLDFDYIERGVQMRAPAKESWRGAFGLTVTMVWLYIELLRILSYFRR